MMSSSAGSYDETTNSSTSLFASSMNSSTSPLVDPYAWSTSLDSEAPLLTSSACSASLTSFFQDEAALAVATEASSHPSGLQSLYAQPYVYAGGGLGNLDECPLQTCLAGAGIRRDSLNFGSVCVPPQCSAYDLAAKDFVGALARASQASYDPALAQRYVTLNQKMAEINEFLSTGWTCGDFVVPWSWLPWSLPYVASMFVLITLSVVAMFRRRTRRIDVYIPEESFSDEERIELVPTVDGFGEEKKQEHYSPKASIYYSNSAAAGVDESRVNKKKSVETGSIWSCFSFSKNLNRITSRHPTETAILDGLRVGSLFWIMLGHVLSIVSSTGAGYSNPANFLPPHGFTTTVPGQLLFSSRLAVDTFLIISGFLVVHVLRRKLPLLDDSSVLWRYVINLPMLLVNRLVRILPLYACVLGFYTQIAPQLGNGPFWWEWLGLLKPCHDYAWTNFLFVNNFVPWDLPTTQTCFYHSWYLAVDMQLFLLAPLLVFWYQANAVHGRRVTVALWAASVLMTIYLSYIREWSINTFDGAAVARYDVEAYAKPHIRAQSYLMGMYVAMLLPDSVLRRRSPYKWSHALAIMFALVAMAMVTFGTATGAYARRPCQYKEWPEKHHCGSLWSPTVTFWYTAVSRTVWGLGVGVLMHICLGRRGNLISSILSWKCWAPLSQLSFGVYLIHPIVIFVWQLGGREKQVFRLLTFSMNYLSVCVVSYVASLLAALLVEFPCTALWQRFTATRRSKRQVFDENRSEQKMEMGEYGTTYGAIGSGYTSLYDSKGNGAQETGPS